MQQASTPEEVVQKAQAAGLVVNYEFADELLHKFGRKKETFNFVQRVIPAEIAKMLGPVFASSSRGKEVFEALRAVGFWNGKAMLDLSDAVRELGGFTGPSLRQVGGSILDMDEAAVGAK